MSDEDFLNLCRLGKAKKVEEAIMNGANVNAKTDTAWTALMSAAVEGNTETVEILLKHGADIKAKNNVGYTALMYATFQGHTDTVNLLLSYGVL